MKTLLLAALLAVPVRAEDSPGAKSLWADVKTWLGGLKTALEESAVTRHQKHARGAVAVAAVRGAAQSLEDPNKPYWKGSAASKQEREERNERAELTKAVDLAIDGKAEEALKALDAFEAAHPKSALLDDCRQAREKLKAAAAKADAPAAEPAKAEALKPAEPVAAKAEAAKPAMPGAASAPDAPKAAPVQADEAKK